MLRKYFKENNSLVEVFNNFNLNISQGEFGVIFGPNGCGKTTLLNIIAGIIAPEGGTVTFANEPMQSVKVGYVFQDYRNSLFPWLTAGDNIAFPLKLQGLGRAGRNDIIQALCKKYGCSLDLNVYPYQLSSGQQQFISLLRGLAVEPQIYLLDEPFSSLDYQTTLSMWGKLADIWQQAKITTLFVSHDIDEAILLAQKIILLSNKSASVIKIFPNPLPYPRQVSIMGTSEFADFKGEILAAYIQEITKSK